MPTMFYQSVTMRRVAPVACVLASCWSASALKNSNQATIRREHRAAVKVAEASASTTNESKDDWVYCAGQWMECACEGKIRWGSPRGWKVLEKSEKPVKCSPFELGDPAWGDATKHCECEVARGSVFEKTISPAVLIDRTPEKPVVSCEIFEKAAKDNAWAEKQWKAVKGMCQSSDHSLLQVEVSATGATTVQEELVSSAGSKAIKADTMRNLMQAWVDPRFKEQYDRYVDKDGWFDEAFVNYVGNSPTGNRYARINEQLVRSVHSFSKKPIVVVHFGMAPPKEWDPKRFPQMILMHAAPLVNERSFNFNKYRAMLLSRVKTAVLLDSDQFVAPGVDALFNRTAEEVTADYPMPILPVHFLEDKTPKTSGFSAWKRYCDGDGAECPRQTLRWGHGHPTWTYFALPHIGRWLRRNFRDETLPPTIPGDASSALRVTDIPEDEDLFNVALWEEKGHKQWCKWDNTDPTDFEMLLSADPVKNECKGWCGDITPDRRFYPVGSPHAFYTAHHAVKPDQSEHYITLLEQRQAKGDLPPPLMYRGKFSADGKKLMHDFPGINCVI